MKLHKPAIFYLTLCLLLVACAGGTSGSIIGSSQSCRAGGGSGSCSGRIGKLTGTYGMDIEDEGIFSGDPVDVELTVSVESGAVLVSVEDPDGKMYSVEIEPGGLGRLVGVSSGEFDGFEITFQAMEDQAAGLSYELIYRTR